MKNLIVTRGRVQNQKTWDMLPPELQKQTTLVCPANEVEIHRRMGRRAYASPVEGIAAKRQWILDKFCASGESTLCMLDDDLVFYRRANPTSYELTDCRGADLIPLFQRIEELVGEYAHVGVSRRGGNNHLFPATKVECGRIMNVHAFNLRHVRDAGASFNYPGLLFMEDFHMGITLLERGYQNAIIADYAWAQPATNSPGGCSLYRNPANHGAAADLLAELHPGIVRVVERRTQTGWAGVNTMAGIRKDVVISWKKAYRQNATESAVVAGEVYQ